MSKSHILCDADIKHLASRLNENSAKILYCLYENESAMEQNKIIKVSELTRMITRDELMRLEGAGFINAVSGSYRRTLYSLTPSGHRLFELHKK
jgi:DNA-binding MarR family transcriptional regulator